MEQDLARMIWAQTWQVTLLILVVAALARGFARNHPHLAHALWMVVLIKAVTPPFWSSPSGVFSWLQSPTPTEEIPAKTETAASTPVADPLPPPPRDWAVMQDLEIENLPASSGRASPAPDVAASSAPRDWELPPREIPETEPVESQPVASRGSYWKEMLLGIWLAGSLGSLLLAVLRWLSCRREIHRAERVPHPEAERLLEQLTVQLKLRRRVRLIVSQSRIGPAVLGVFRPTVLIPARILEGKPPADLEPILAHELIHIRRGDLWIGWLQVVVQSVWWFHPLVWWAGRLLKHEAERCCDEEVVAELGCKPARYARALLNVLELKQILKPVPVLPGVKPVEITSQRLERIMLLRQGCRKRTPWWCWLVMLLTAALTLPGAAFVASAKEKTNRKARETRTTEASQTRRYKIGDVLERYQSEYKIQNKTLARSTLAEFLKSMVGELWYAETALGNWEKVEPSITIKGETLRIRHTPRVLDRIAEGLENLREYGFAQIAIEARIITAGRDVVEKAVSRWEVLPSERPQNTGPETQVDNGVSSTTEKSAPLRMAILKDPQVKKVIEACQSDARSNLMFCPKVTVFNGQHATIQDTVQTPFVVGISSDGKPTIRVVESGTKIQLRAIWKGDQIHLESQVTLSDIRKVDVMNLPGKAGGESSPQVQVPEVATTRINNTVKLPSGGSVLLGGLNLPNEGRVPAGRSLFDSLGLTTPPEIPEQQWFIVLRVVHLENTLEQLPVSAKIVSDVEIRDAQTAAELAALEYETALKANRRHKGTVSQLDVERLKLKAERAHRLVERLKHELEQASKAEREANASRQNRPAEARLKPQPTTRGTLLYFEADWCGPCQQMNTIVSQFQREGYPVRSVDVDKERELAQQFNVKSLPTFLLVVDGKERERLVGVTSESQLQRLLTQIPADSNPPVASHPSKWTPHSTLPYHGQNLMGTGINSEVGASGSIRLTDHSQPPSPINDGQILPSAYYLADDVVYFPPPPADQRMWQRENQENQTLQEMVEEFNTLIKEKKYREAESLGITAINVFPQNETAKLLLLKARTILRNQKEPGNFWVDFGQPRPARNQRETKKPLQQQLDQKVSVRFQQTPLQDAVKDLAVQAGVNVVIDNKGLAEEGVLATQPVTMELENVKLSSVLTLLLEPLNLGYVNEDEVLKITGETAIDQRTVVVITYPVADLVVPLPAHRVTLDLREKITLAKSEPKRPAAQTVPTEKWEGRIPPAAHRQTFDFDGLIKLIESTVEPDSWESNGGIGSIRSFETTLSLVVRHKHSVHEKIRDLLEQLRALQDRQVSLEVCTVSLKDLGDQVLLKKLGAGKPIVLDPKQVAALKATAQQSPTTWWSAPKITLFDGQSAHLILPAKREAGFGLNLIPVATADRRFVRLQFEWDAAGAKDEKQSSLQHLKDGHSVLMDVSGEYGTADSERKFMLITTRIIVQEEEEELLGIETKK